MKRKYLLNKLLLVVIAAFVAGGLPAAADDDIEEGWYYISADYNGTTEGLYVNNSRLSFDPLETGDPAYIFQLVKAEDPNADLSYSYNKNMFYVYNMKEKSWYQGSSYMKETDGITLQIFQKDASTRQYWTFEKNGNDQFYIRPQLPATSFSTEGNNNFRGTFAFRPGTRATYKQSYAQNTIDNWTDKASFSLQKVPDDELNAARLKVALREACQLVNDQSIFTTQPDKLITNGTSTAESGTADYYSGIGSQFYCPLYPAGNTYWEQNGKLSYLIDGKVYSRFLSTDNSSGLSRVTPSFLQVDISTDDTDNKQVQGVKLEMTTTDYNLNALRPTNISLYATNDASVAETGSIKTIEEVEKSDSWTKIGDYNFKPALTEVDGRYSSDHKFLAITKGTETVNDNIIFPDGGKYRFLRFYVNNTTANYTLRRTFQLGEFQLYEISDITATTRQAEAMAALRELIGEEYTNLKNGTVSADDVTYVEQAIKAVQDGNNLTRNRLMTLIDSLDNAGIKFSTGTAPGSHVDSLVTAYYNALDSARAGTHLDLSDAEYENLSNLVVEALETAKNTLVPITDGYYFITNADGSFYHTKAMVGLPTQNILGWEDYDQTNPAELFKITKTGEGQYSIQNAVTGKYINTVAGQSQEPTVTDTPMTPQTITGIEGYPGQFNIANTANPMAYHAEFHQSGANAKGYICTWDGGANTFSAWKLVPMNGTELEDLLFLAEPYKLNILAQAEIDTARTAYDLTYGYTATYRPEGDMTYGGLITNVDETDTQNCQVRARQEPGAVTDGYSSYANLIDGTTSTCFQSTWQSSLATAPQYFQVDLKDHPVSDFKFLFGLRDGQWGAWEQWTNITIYASNDEETASDENITTKDQMAALDTWKNIGDYRLPEEYAKRNWGGSNRRIYVDVNHMGDKYRFIRFYINNTYRPFGVGTYTVGEFQIYENTYDEANMPYTYVTGLKEAADQLKAQEKILAENIETYSVTQEDLNQFIALRKTVEAMTPVKSVLQGIYQADSTYVSNFAADGDAYGDVTASEMTAMETALDNAKAVFEKAQPSRAELDEQARALGEAFAAFKNAQIQFEPNKWYYIVGQDLTRQGSTDNNGAAYTGGIDETFTYGNCAYAATDNTSDSEDGLGTDNRNALKWGYYVAGTGTGGSNGADLYTDEIDPHTMWRFVPVENGEYAIQNRATGRFMTGYASSTPLGLTADSAAYVFENLGSGQYKFRSTNANIYMQFAGNGLLKPSGNSNLPSSQWSFTLVPVETDDDMMMETINDNSITIKSLPYAISQDILALSDGAIGFYGVKGLEVVGSDSTLLLEKKTSIEAGEPFIMISGDYTAFDINQIANTQLALPAVDEFSFEGKTINGLTATLDYTRPSKPGLGYFADAVVKATAADTGIEGHTGYFDVKNMPLFTTTTDADQRIPLNGAGVDAIKSITTSKDGVVNVYSIDGKLIKKNVSGSKAAKGLQKGLYIVGKKKVSVK